ncbi:MAG: hypothetical protein UR26_C0003G0014 [candidate division TM6 bacterium GW2011_GWF2_32_72]|nr:MAG: hypothetical protein UR26_C0003G0014 [candidate division TM6 bacterium GW2011_GWF2_32_72]
MNKKLFLIIMCLPLTYSINILPSGPSAPSKPKAPKPSKPSKPSGPSISPSLPADIKALASKPLSDLQKILDEKATTLKNLQINKDNLTQELTTRQKALSKIADLEKTWGPQLPLYDQMKKDLISMTEQAKKTAQENPGLVTQINQMKQDIENGKTLANAIKLLEQVKASIEALDKEMSTTQELDLMTIKNTLNSFINDLQTGPKISVNIITNEKTTTLSNQQLIEFAKILLEQISDSEGYKIAKFLFETKAIPVEAFTFRSELLEQITLLLNLYSTQKISNLNLVNECKNFTNTKASVEKLVKSFEIDKIKAEAKFMLLTKQLYSTVKKEQYKNIQLGTEALGQAVEFLTQMTKELGITGGKGLILSECLKNLVIFARYPASNAAIYTSNFTLAQVAPSPWIYSTQSANLWLAKIYEIVEEPITKSTAKIGVILPLKDVFELLIKICWDCLNTIQEPLPTAAKPVTQKDFSTAFAALKEDINNIKDADIKAYAESFYNKLQPYADGDLPALNPKINQETINTIDVLDLQAYSAQIISALMVTQVNITNASIVNSYITSNPVTTKASADTIRIKEQQEKIAKRRGRK